MADTSNPHGKTQLASGGKFKVKAAGGTKPTELPISGEIEGLIAQLKWEANSEAAVSKMMADAKTERQADRDDYPELASVGYSWTKPEDTTAWKAATALSILQREVAERDEVLREARELLYVYRHKTPLGHQPHMIAGAAETTVTKIDALLQQKEGCGNG